MIKRTLAVIVLATALSACGNSSEAAAPPPATQEAVSAAEATAPVEATQIVTLEDAVTEEPTEVPAAGTTEAPTSAETTTEPAQAPEASQPQEAFVNTKLNLNEAAGEDFQTVIPDFGDRMVREFLEYRPYVSIQQFRQEIGKYVDEAQVAAYEKYVYVPVNVNESDAATLQQIPGIDETVAAELIAARPYESNEAFLTKLGPYASEIELAVAGSYLVSP